MPEINYKEFEAYLQKLSERADKGTSDQSFLIFGEELLCKKSYEALVDKLLPGDSRRHNLEAIDGAKEAIYDAVNSMNTYSLLSVPKVVSVPDARIFYGKQDKSKFLDKAKAAYEKDNKKKASQYLKSLLEQLQLTFEDVSQEKGLGHLIPKGESPSSYDWLRSLIADAKEMGLQTGTSGQPEAVLQNAIEKGFPKGNYLILTTDLVDKRRSLFKSFKENGIAINCAVPKGDRKADKAIQEEVLKDRMQQLLSANKKSMDTKAFYRLYEMTGFDLRTFSNNLEKLILYVGDRPNITSQDVEKTLDRTKLDPIYEFTNAVSDRNLDQALLTLDSLFASGMHPLQVFTALVNHFRKILMAKSFTQSRYGYGWQPGLPFNVFKTEVMPRIQEYDREISDHQEAWLKLKETGEEEKNATRGKRAPKKAKKKVKIATDILVAPNPKNPYPIYQMLKKADKFSMDQLSDFYAAFNRVDMSLKRSAQAPQLIIEDIILHICTKKSGNYIIH